MAASNEFERHLQKAMGSLPERSRLVLLLASMDGHSLEDVAKVLPDTSRYGEIAPAFRTEAAGGKTSMICDKYKHALLLAATNNELEAKLSQHLQHCSKCRTTLCSERELFSRIDTVLRAQVNGDPRPGFLTDLRVQLSKEQATRPGSNRMWQLAGAALALILISDVLSAGKPATTGSRREMCKRLAFERRKMPP